MINIDNFLLDNFLEYIVDNHFLDNIVDNLEFGVVDIGLVEIGVDIVLVDIVLLDIVLVVEDIDPVDNYPLVEKVHEGHEDHVEKDHEEKVEV